MFKKKYTTPLIKDFFLKKTKLLFNKLSRNELIFCISYKLQFFIFSVILLSFSCENKKHKTFHNYLEAFWLNDVSQQISIINETSDSTILKQLLYFNRPQTLVKHDLNDEFLHERLELLNKLETSFDSLTISKLTALNTQKSVTSFQSELLYNQIQIALLKEISYSRILPFAKEKEKHLSKKYIDTSQLLYKYFFYLNDIKKNKLLEGQKLGQLATTNMHLSQINQYENHAFKYYFESFLRADASIYAIKEFGFNQYENLLNFQLQKLKKLKGVSDTQIKIIESYVLEDQGKNKESLLLLNDQIDKIDKAKDKYRTSLNLGVAYLEINPDSAFHYFNKAHLLFENWPCHAKNIIPLVYLIHSAQDRSSFVDYREKLKSLYNCPDKNGYYAEFIGLDFLRDHPFSNYSIAERIDINNRRKTLAEMIWTGKESFHIQDIYAYITSDLLQLYQDDPKAIENDGFTTIINLFQETKIQELKRKRFEDQSYVLSESQKQTENRISEILKTTNEFLDTLYDGDPMYIELYNLMVEKQSWSQNLSASDLGLAQKPLNEQSLAQLKKLNTLEYFVLHDIYWYYYFDGDKLQLGQFNGKKLDSLLQNFNEQLITLKNPQAQIKELRALILPKDLSCNKNVLILADGNTFQIPFDLLLPDKSIFYHFDLNEYISMDTINLTEPTIGLISYTDKQTQNSTQLKEYPELPLGWQETQTIGSYFPPNKIQSIAGYQLNKHSFESALDMDIAHISSHASMNMNNRLDNYILVRNAEGKSDKLYSYEIENLPQAPQVVTLSACETGTGAHRNGAGTYSISRAFLHAGSSSIIKSLWKVNEKATSVFMPALYKHWQQGLSLGEALNQAKEEVRQMEAFKHPYFWAGFILEGNPNIYLERDSQ